VEGWVSCFHLFLRNGSVSLVIATVGVVLIGTTIGEKLVVVCIDEAGYKRSIG